MDLISSDIEILFLNIGTGKAGKTTMPGRFTSPSTKYKDIRSELLKICKKLF